MNKITKILKILFFITVAVISLLFLGDKGLLYWIEYSGDKHKIETFTQRINDSAAINRWHRFKDSGREK